MDTGTIRNIAMAKNYEFVKFYILRYEQNSIDNSLFRKISRVDVPVLVFM